jgi:ATP-dependent Clp protease ATP-binding subunit ClpC
VEKIIQRGPPMGAMGNLPFTPRAKRVLETAVEESAALGHSYIGTEHLLLGLIQSGESVPAVILQNLGIRLELVREAVMELVGVDSSGGKRHYPKPIVRMSPAGGNALNRARVEAEREGLKEMGPEHLLLGLVEEGGEGFPLYQALGLTPEKVREEIRKLRGEGDG